MKYRTPFDHLDPDALKELFRKVPDDVKWDVIQLGCDLVGLAHPRPAAEQQGDHLRQPKGRGHHQRADPAGQYLADFGAVVEQTFDHRAVAHADRRAEAGGAAVRRQPGPPDPRTP